MYRIPSPIPAISIIHDASLKVYNQRQKFVKTITNFLMRVISGQIPLLMGEGLAQE